jgi:mannose-6-phosphate isomerase-like protein (cupin superfamily)
VSGVKDVLAEVSFSADKMKKVGLFETERLFCDVYCFEPGQEQKMHVHANSDKIYYVLSGEGSFQVGSESSVLTKGKIIMAGAGSEHGVRNTGSERLTVLVFVAPRP